jgi:hypothetical protein
MRIAQRGLRHVGGVGEHDVALDGRQLVGELFQEWHEGEVDEDDAVGGVIDDPHDLFGEEPRIDGVIDGADAEDAVPGLEMPPRIPGKRRHPVAELDAVALEPLGDLEGTGADIGVVRGVHRPLDRARNHRAGAVIGRRMVDHPVAQQRPVLHQAEHVVSPRTAPWSCPLSGGPLRRRLTSSLARPARHATGQLAQVR